MNTNEKDKPVGYGAPPISTRFKPGQSGNLRGRPKKPKTLKAELIDELDELVNVGEAGSETQVSKRRAIAKSLVQQAVSGDLRATKALISIFARDPLEAEQADEATHDEKTLLQDYVDREMRRRGEQSSQINDIEKE